MGLAFSLLTQFTEKSYGTDVNGMFLVVDVQEKSKPFIGKDVPQKILMGTITWFFHLVSDVAGSSSTAGITGGTGIPGPILALAKEISAIPLFRDLKVNDDASLSLFLSKLFNGTLMMQRDENGQIIKESVIKFDLRGELGVTHIRTNSNCKSSDTDIVNRHPIFLCRNCFSDVNGSKHTCRNSQHSSNSRIIY